MSENHQSSSCCGGCGGQGKHASQPREQQPTPSVGTFDPNAQSTPQKQSLLSKLGSLLGGR